VPEQHESSLSLRSADVRRIWWLKWRPNFFRLYFSPSLGFVKKLFPPAKKLSEHFFWSVPLSAKFFFKGLQSFSNRSLAH
jgi:hypothetical protein